MDPTTSLPPSYRGPGLFDLQVNGYAGVDLNAPAERWTAGALRRVREAMAARGVSMALPTLITDDAERMIERARVWARLVDASPELARAFPLLHLEGPFLSAVDGPRGAHPRAHCRTPRELPDLFDRIVDASGGRVGLLTLAPELPGALELIASATAQGVRVAVGHTEATVEILEAAIAAGAVLSTHLGNGTHAILPRHANYVQAQLAEDRLCASFIADGHHLPWYALQNFLRAKSYSRSILVTDAVAPADAPPGHYPLADEEVECSADGRVHKPGQTNLAGSALTLDRAVVNVALHCRVPFAAAWAMASTQPAALLGLDPAPEVEVEISARGFRAVSGSGAPAR
jgi:N-acetylglucosamine-6-phosphate deacetylase